MYPYQRTPMGNPYISSFVVAWNSTDNPFVSPSTRSLSRRSWTTRSRQCWYCIVNRLRDHTHSKLGRSWKYGFVDLVFWRHNLWILVKLDLRRFEHRIRITNNRFGSSPIADQPWSFQLARTAIYATCWVVVGSWSFGWRVPWQAQMIQPVHSRKGEANPKFGTTMSIFGNIKRGMPCNQYNSMKQATQSLRDSRMKECPLLVIIWMSGQAVMNQKKWHAISMLVWLQIMPFVKTREPPYRQSSTLRCSVLCLWPSMMPPGSAQRCGLHRATL